MPKTAEEVLNGVLSTTLQLDETGVAELKESDGSWKDDALDVLKKRDAERITKVKGDTDKLKSDNYSRGKREAMEQLEAELREEYGYKDATKKGKELINDLIAEKLKAEGLTDEAKIKRSPIVLNLERQLSEKEAEKTKALEDKEAEIVARFEGEQNYQTVINEAAVIFDTWEPVLPEDKTKAANLKRDFLDKLRQDKFQVTRKDGKVDIIPVDPKGEGTLKDDHGHAVSLKALVESRMGLYFEQVASEKRSSAPDPNKVGNRSGDGGSGNYPATMTQADYMREYEALTKLPKAERDVKIPILDKHAKALGLVK